jgi:phosphoglucomutase
MSKLPYGRLAAAQKIREYTAERMTITVAESGWFAARPSGTENIYKIYAESFRGANHLRRILEEAQTIVSDALAAVPEQGKGRASSVLPQETVRKAKEKWRNERNPH